jgi:hypothetical protein
VNPAFSKPHEEKVIFPAIIIILQRSKLEAPPDQASGYVSVHPGHKINNNFLYFENYFENATILKGIHFDV